MDHVFLAVQDKISEAVPEIKWVDYDFGQLEHYQLRPPVLFPCALIDIELPECSDKGNLMQQFKCIVTIRVAFEQPGQTNNKVPDSVKAKAMSIFMILDKIHSAIHGFEKEGFEKILMRSITTERRDDPLKVLNMRFETSYTIDKRKGWKMITITPVVVVEKTIEIEA